MTRYIRKSFSLHTSVWAVDACFFPFQIWPMTILANWYVIVLFFLAMQRQATSKHSTPFAKLDAFFSMLPVAMPNRKIIQNSWIKTYLFCLNHVVPCWTVVIVTHPNTYGPLPIHSCCTQTATTTKKNGVCGKQQQECLLWVSSILAYLFRTVTERTIIFFNDLARTLRVAYIYIHKNIFVQNDMVSSVNTGT